MEANWAGLVTNASPFLLPAGAAVEQANLSSRVPGILRSRGGMRAVESDGSPEMPAGVADVAAVEISGSQAVLCMLPDGSVQCLVAPAAGEETAAPDAAELTAPSGGVTTHYTFAYKDNRA